MQTTRLGWLGPIMTGLLAIILLGGTVAGWLLGKDPPSWLTGFDGVIVVAVFSNGAFFAQARSAIPTAAALDDLMEKYHALATAGIQIANHSQSSVTESTGGMETTK